MLQLKNKSPFKATIALFPNDKGIDTLYTVIKATFTLEPKLEVAEEQAPIVMADEYWGEPGQSSLKYASEMHLLKPSTDVVMVGEACMPDKQPVTELSVRLKIGDKEKTVLVFGDRQWEKGIMGLRKSEPVAFESMPMTFERAYGGTHVIDPETDKIVYEAFNPVGLGFNGKKTKKEIDGSPLPNLENPDKLINSAKDQPAPACFGYVAPAWEPRKSFAGTYDDAWQKKRAPYLPEDFDPRFFNMASPDLIMDQHLNGGEPVIITNMSVKGPILFNLPQCEFDFSVDVDNKIEKPELNLETVLLEPNKQSFSMLWRAALECDKKTLKVNEININLNKIQL